MLRTLQSYDCDCTPIATVDQSQQSMQITCKSNLYVTSKSLKRFGIENDGSILVRNQIKPNFSLTMPSKKKYYEDSFHITASLRRLIPNPACDLHINDIC